MLDHFHMREVFRIGEGDSSRGATTATSLALDADTVERGHPIGGQDTSHWADLQAFATAGAAVGIAGRLGLEKTGRGTVGLERGLVFLRMGFAGNSEVNM